ncbi:hypothetical protein Trydic_g3655 [Trypoxylus dichotomus]
MINTKLESNKLLKPKGFPTVECLKKNIDFYQKELKKNLPSKETTIKLKINTLGARITNETQQLIEIRRNTEKISPEYSELNKTIIKKVQQENKESECAKN